jgi:type II secretion system protein H
MQPHRRKSGAEARNVIGCSRFWSRRFRLSSRASRVHLRSFPGFTLIELMVVVAIMGIVMTMAVPAIYRQLHPDSMQKAVSDIVEACSHARAQAILNGRPMEVQIRPLDHVISVGQAARSISRPDSPSVSGGEWRMQDRSSAGNAGSRGETGNFSASLSQYIRIDLLDVNFLEYKDEDLAQVRFYPNGTSDEFTIVLSNDKNEWRMISLEVVTGLPDVQTDPNKVLKRLQ